MSDDGLNTVDVALRRWRTSATPLEDGVSASDRRSRTLATIASSMRQGKIDRQRARRGRFWAAGLVAAGMLVGLGAWTVAATRPTGSIVAESAVVSGKAWLWSGSTKHRVESGVEQAIRVGDRVLTDSGKAQLAVGAITHIAVAEQSEVVLSQNRSDLKRVTLRGGVIDVDVEPHHNARVEVQTPQARIVVHGTRFSVAVSRPDGETSVTSVRVRRGVVAVLRGGREVARLRAGESWTSKLLAEQQVTTAPAETKAAQQNAPPVTEKRNGKRTVARQQLRRPAVPPSEAVADPSTLAEQNQMFRRAVDARNRGDDEQALKSFEALLSKYPQSALAQEARVERFRALKRLGRGSEAAKAARRYLMDHTNGFAKDEARGLALTPDDANSSN